MIRLWITVLWLVDVNIKLNSISFTSSIDQALKLWRGIHIRSWGCRNALMLIGGVWVACQNRVGISRQKVAQADAGVTTPARHVPAVVVDSFPSFIFHFLVQCWIKSRNLFLNADMLVLIQCSSAGWRYANSQRASITDESSRWSSKDFYCQQASVHP